MTGLLITAAVVAALAAAVWAAPWVANQLLVFVMWLFNRRITAFNKRQEQRRAETTQLLRQLEQYVSRRNT